MSAAHFARSLWESGTTSIAWLIYIVGFLVIFRIMGRKPYSDYQGPYIVLLPSLFVLLW